MVVVVVVGGTVGEYISNASGVDGSGTLHSNNNRTPDSATPESLSNDFMRLLIRFEYYL